MTPARFLALAAILVLTFVVAVVVLLVQAGGGPTQTQGQPSGRFPKLKPILSPPQGYFLEGGDGPDFTHWQMVEEGIPQGKISRSGIGIRIEVSPTPPKNAKESAERVQGRACGQDVEWIVTRGSPIDPNSVHYRTIVAYQHDPSCREQKIQISFYGSGQSQVDALARLVEDLKFSERTVGDSRR